MKEGISIIIPVLNCLDYTKSVIEQIKSYTNGKYEIIIIDNGSNDGTKEFLNKYKSEYLNTITNDYNKGYSHANNQGINVAKYSHICFLNNDVLLFKNWNIPLMTALEDSEVAFSGPVTNNSAGIQCENYNFADVSAKKYHIFAEQNYKLNRGIIKGKFVLIGFCLVGKTDTIKKLNGFDEGFKLGNFEDNDLTTRGILLKGFNVILEDCFIYHYGSITFKHNDKYNIEIYKKNAQYFVNKWGGYFEGKKYFPPVQLKTQCYKNVNYLTDIDNMEIMSLGNYGVYQKNIDKLDINSKIKKLNELLIIRPFNPDALLGIIDCYLSLNDNKNANIYINQLLNLTPELDIAKNLCNIKSNLSVLNSKASNDRITVCIITKNEEKNIQRCLESIKNIAHEIIILDTGSSDNTINIAKKYTEKIKYFQWIDDFSAARNKCLSYARGDWVLFLDADEELDKNSAETLKFDINKPNILGYRLPLKNVNSPLIGVNYVPRLVRNAPGLHFIFKIHETIFASVLLMAKEWNMKTDLGKTRILHYGYEKNEMESKNKLKRNLKLYEQALLEYPNEISILMNYAHDLNHDGQIKKAYDIFKNIHEIFESHASDEITPEVREQFIHNYGVFLAQENKMKELAHVMSSRTAQETGPVANVHYMAGLALINCKRFKEAIHEFDLCIKKSEQDTLAPSVPDIRSWKPTHLLANAHASLGNEDFAIKYWNEIIYKVSDSAEPFHDYARYLSSLGRNMEAMKILRLAISKGLSDQKVWELGSRIVNSNSELLTDSLKWTENAVNYYPNSNEANFRRGESLMKNGYYKDALPFFDNLTNLKNKNVSAAQIFCRIMNNSIDNNDLNKAKYLKEEINNWLIIMENANGSLDSNHVKNILK